MPKYQYPAEKDSQGRPKLAHVIAEPIRKMQRDMRRTNRQFENAALGKTDAGTPLGVVGDLGDGTVGAHFRRQDGSTAFKSYAAPDGSGFAGIYDRTPNYIFSDDSFSGRGIGRPYLPIPMTAIVPPVSGGQPKTNATAWTNMAVGFGPLQHPGLYACALVQIDANTTANLRLNVDQVGQGTPVAVSAGYYGLVYIGPLAWSGVSDFYEQFHTVYVDAQITSGTGYVGLWVVGCYGVESAMIPS